MPIYVWDEITYSFLFWMEHCGVWDRCILGFVKLVSIGIVILHRTVVNCSSTHEVPLLNTTLDVQLVFMTQSNTNAAGTYTLEKNADGALHKL